MNFDFLSPVSEFVIAKNELNTPQSLGKKCKIHSKQNGLPDLEDIQIAILGVLENRNDVNYMAEQLNFDAVRTSLYQLFPGNWHTQLADLGDIKPGESVEDTYFALKTAISILVEKQIIPLLIGGSQDLMYAVYRAFDTITPMVNIVNVDTNFDLGDSNLPIKNNSYLGKVILDKPYNLFNYSVIGYQTYFNSQEEIDLMDKLYFEAYRLGEITSNTQLVEPVMRDATIVGLDLKSVKASEVGRKQQYSPNGFSGQQICAIARYAGISNKVRTFGIYEYKFAPNEVTDMLMAQILWYFIEGVNCRIKDDSFSNLNDYQKYNVLVEDEELIFIKSIKTGRWWIEIPFLPDVNNKLKKHTLLPCMHQDYTDASHGKIPERWYKAYKKNSF
ncbi:formimidoylglutamase [Paucihalobacter sp.]|uniref:formimidoylglutamase n=1 Tax=Paucihalobacter sp. TaxID=2850405 RepID=UPI002FE3FE10